ncbi:23S rRNA (cytidine(2498)-2'-O)-methyltransferase RlmM [Vibrio genomosp. F10]|uniref:Ribosomal RNA large subunit methyltransferase M n=2 Tax=Vibrio genomosp. F10 TaxID=723171 RepID=A0A1B9QYN9_9VIBR|nr:23S rRNA (cytidine(2498)-2'-O)-methyltransferase RlmM [Vibrio genomosp. F10]OCH75527.1 23S rRNA (cytidine(2498)-2'-O)-methyltransferase RlmM [Vibrio genomosp. F10]OEE35077.1 23S rRNA (cytidine(2498)-2'-O)-methyltransferase RlmM [Vibrio genomosp. F10 str. ZF-129]OEE93018.1 23S rRNA (cytidine(2498)-2'-O)-methyltransferase RlmM [Vibrio genomosp. F10 str. 9ZC157]OEF04410.1 23S rRNA (cytidine(2498)-2'-O)-methyltransferase RlmM [Vibrio genomosp. F10 str. 9ZB36]OEF23581.1 23S rRNA (cytidine(2498)-
MKHVMLYCRSGFEKECAGEIQDKANHLEVYGFPRVQKNTGYVLFECYQEGDAGKLIKSIDFQTLIFARQMFAVATELTELPTEDRISPILQALSEVEGFPRCGDIRIETPDTNEAKELLKFCRKFTVPMRQAMRGKGLMFNKDNPKKPVMHICFVAPGHCYVGYSNVDNNSKFFMGIPRLKFPADAPSRSTLKLEEAFHVFIPRDEWDERLASGMWGVDLGACPGGWTYQLVKRSMFVHAVDNGMMADSLMETGQVKHHQVDGFKFEPDRKNVTWLICDMIEKPSRVAQLMGEWIISGWAKEAIFNLKLPMKGRYDEVLQDIENLKQFLTENDVKYKLQAKHLYHDREEITVHLQCLSNISPH